MVNSQIFVKASRAEVIGSMAALVPGDLVLDVGSACGHMARWFYEPWSWAHGQGEILGFSNLVICSGYFPMILGFLQFILSFFQFFFWCQASTIMDDYAFDPQM